MIIKEIILADGQIALIDDVNYAEISKYSWYSTCGYAFTKISTHLKKPKQYSLSMHRLILGLTKGDQKQVDHINRNGLDNRKINLRFCDASLNAANRKIHKKQYKEHIFKGVYFERSMKRKKRWRARIEVKGIKHDLGMFHTDEEAALAYNIAALQYFGQFARINEMQ